VKHAILIGILALVAAAVVAVTAQGKSANALSFVTKQQSFAQIDVGKKGFSVGDSFIFVEQLLANGKTVGHDRILCTHVANTRANGELCSGSVVLAGGTIQLAGLSSEGPFTVAVVGGTGDYAGARGTARVVSQNAKGSIAITLL
jgi:hypothetical protein